MLKHPEVITIEKPLYQIAIERILDRFIKAPAGVKNDVILLFQMAAKGAIQDKEDQAKIMIEKLFPELYPKCNHNWIQTATRPMGQIRSVCSKCDTFMDGGTAGRAPNVT